MKEGMAITEQTIINADVPGINRQFAEHHVQRHNMAGFRAPKLDTVRVGLIGLRRGANHIKALVQLEGVEIRAICDKRPEIVEQAMVWFEGTDHKPEIYSSDGPMTGRSSASRRIWT
jgi:hypothetical protein